MAFHDRGGGDYAHHDMEDIITVLTGSSEVVSEVAASAVDVKSFVREEMEELLFDERFVEQLGWFFDPSKASQHRVPMVLDRLRQLAGL